MAGSVGPVEAVLLGWPEVDQVGGHVRSVHFLEVVVLLLPELIFGLPEFFVESENLLLVMDFEPLYFVAFLLQFFPQGFGLSVLPILEFLGVLPLGVE